MTAPVHVTKRLIVAFLFLVAAAAVIIYAWPATEQDAPPATVDVVIDGPDGQIWNGTVTADPGTAFGALVAAAESGGFTIHWTGQGGTLYVDEVAGHTESGGGWCVQTDDGSGTGWQDSPLSPALYRVEDGWVVRWYWTDGACDEY